MTTTTKRTPRSKKPSASKRARPAAAPAAAPPPPAEPLELRAPTPIEIELGKLVFDNKPDRLDELLDESEIADLAASFRQVGLMHPITVTRFGVADGMFRVVAGRRRSLAVKKAGGATIPAVVLECRTEDDVLTARAIENLKRQDLNPIEEAMSVAHLVETLALHAAELEGVDLEGEAYQGFRVGDEPAWQHAMAIPLVRNRALGMAAERLAKSITWVRDRAFLGRLSGKSRQLVVAGKLPLAHAREIAKLADPVMRDQIAADAAIGARRYGAEKDQPMPMEELRRTVSRYLLTLAQVPWSLTRPFAGEPACVECPCNSANTPGLFDHGGKISTSLKEGRSSSRWAEGTVTKEPAAGVCTNRSCYAKKSGAANRALASAATKVARTHREAPKAERESLNVLASSMAPDFIDHRKVVALATDRLRPRRSGKGEAAAIAAASRTTTPDPKRQAREKYDAAAEKWAKALEPKIAAKLKGIRGSWAVYQLFFQTRLVRSTQSRSNDAKVARAVASPAMKAALKHLADPSWEAVKDLERDCGTQYDLLSPWYDGPSGLAAAIAEALGIEPNEPAPRLEDFLPKSGTDSKPAKGGKPIVDDGDDE